MVAEDDPAYGAFLNWMYFSDATLTFPQTLVLRYTQLEPEERRNPQVATDYAKWFLGRLRAVEAATANSETLCAGRFTAADIVIGYALRLANSIGLAKDFGPNVRAYWGRLRERDGYKRALAAEQRAGRRAECRAAGEGVANLVIASEAKQSRVATASGTGLLRRFAPRNDELFALMSAPSQRPKEPRAEDRHGRHGPTIQAI